MPLQDAPKRLEQGLDWKRTIKNRERAFGQHGVQATRGIALRGLWWTHHHGGWWLIQTAKNLQDATAHGIASKHAIAHRNADIHHRHMDALATQERFGLGATASLEAVHTHRTKQWWKLPLQRVIAPSAVTQQQVQARLRGRTPPRRSRSGGVERVWMVSPGEHRAGH